MRRTTADVAKTLISESPDEVLAAPKPKRLPWRPFPLHVVPPTIATYIADAARAFGCDAAMIATHVLAVLGAAIGTTQRIRLKRSWNEYPIIWTAVVASSGKLKSPPHEAAVRPVHDLQQQLIELYHNQLVEYEKKQQQYELQEKDWRKSDRTANPPEKPVKPVLHHIIVVDPTVESIAPRLEDQPRGLLLARDELSGLFAFDSYKAAKGNDVAHYLEMHRGGALKIDRKHGDRTTIYVPRAAVSICGTIQPEILKSVLGRQHFQNGFAARMLFTAPPTKPKQWSEAEISESVEDEYAGIVRELFTLQNGCDKQGRPCPIDLPLSHQAKQGWIGFYDEHGRVQDDAPTQDLAAAFSKLEGYAARLALIIHCVRCVTGEVGDQDVIGEQSIRAGIELAQWFVHETERVYALLNGTGLDSEGNQLVELIENHGGEISVRELSRRRRKYSIVDKAEAALDQLKAAGVGYWREEVPSSVGGRPTRTFCLLREHEALTKPLASDS